MVDIRFDNSCDVGTLAEGSIEFKDELIDYRVERRLKVTPFLGMKQPVPNGSFLGSECIAVLTASDKKIAGYKLHVFCEEEGTFKFLSEKFTDDRGESGDLQIPMPFRGIRNFQIRVMGAVEEPVQLVEAEG